MTTRKRLMVPIGDVKPYDRNPRHNDGAVDAVKASIEEFGFRGCILVDASMTIIAGHTRLKAAKALGMKEVPVEIADDLTEDQVKALRLVDNRTAELSGWDFDLLTEELEGIADIDMEGWFPSLDGEVDFENLDSMTSGGAEGYDEFVEKFKPKKTADDCYTPPEISAVVGDYVAEQYGIDHSRMVRPFYPGGYYQAYDYPDGAVVVDNPPFSIVAEILDYYADRDIPYFLFAPYLVMLCTAVPRRVSMIVTDTTLTYANGAEVNTGFLTNLHHRPCIKSDPDLRSRLRQAQGVEDGVLVRYEYPRNLLTCRILGPAVREEWSIPLDAVEYVRTIDGHPIIGGGVLMSDRDADIIAEAKAKWTHLIEKVPLSLSAGEEAVVEELNRRVAE